MAIERINGKPVRLAPGRVEIRLGDEHRQAYRRSYAGYQSYLSGLPVLRDHDFDGRAVRVTRPELAALNAAFAELDQTPAEGESSFSAQEHAKKRLFKKLQYLS